MKKHAIIPVFIPHLGCPNDCVFCNQKKITARSGAVSAADVEETVNRYMSTLSQLEPRRIELSFYGGSFTGLPEAEQNMYLDIAVRYKREGLIGGIHLSTRPDYIDEAVLANLAEHDVDVIELGVQSFDDEVLAASGRGHTSDDVRRACGLISDYGFTLGIQLMIGLPGDSRESCIYSAREAVKLKPALARLYPTVILEDTRLLEMYRDGSYIPFSLEESVGIAREMYLILEEAGINIIRVGLKSTDVIESAAYGGTYHPAFRQLVESEIARERIEAQLRDDDTCVRVLCSPASLSNAAGHGGSNRKYFREKYPGLVMTFAADEDLEANKYLVVRQEGETYESSSNSYR